METFKVQISKVTNEIREISLPFYGKIYNEHSNKFVRILAPNKVFNIAFCGEVVNTHFGDSVIFDSVLDYTPCSQQEFEMAKERLLTIIN